MANNLSEVWADISSNYSFLQRGEITSMPVNRTEIIENYKGKISEKINDISDGTFSYDKEAVANVVKNTIKAAGIGVSAGANYTKSFLDEHNLTEKIENAKTTVADAYRNSKMSSVFNDIVKQAKENISITYDAVVPDTAKESLHNAAEKIRTVSKSAVDAFKSGYNEYGSSKSESDEISLG